MKCLLCKHHIKSWAWRYVPVLPVLEKWDRRIPEACWPDSPAESENSRFSERPCLQKQKKRNKQIGGDGQWEKTKLDINLWFPHCIVDLCAPRPTGSICAHKHTQTHTTSSRLWLWNYSIDNNCIYYLESQLNKLNSIKAIINFCYEFQNHFQVNCIFNFI